jgi:hypothetical protein
MLIGDSQTEGAAMTQHELLIEHFKRGGEPLTERSAPDLVRTTALSQRMGDFRLKKRYREMMLAAGLIDRNKWVKLPSGARLKVYWMEAQ